MTIRDIADIRGLGGEYDLSNIANESYKHSKQTGGRGQYGHVEIILEPAEAGKGFEFVDAIKGGAVLKEYIPAVEKGILLYAF